MTVGEDSVEDLLLTKVTAWIYKEPNLVCLINLCLHQKRPFNVRVILMFLLKQSMR